jgi:hypothetical protein
MIKIKRIHFITYLITLFAIFISGCNTIKEKEGNQDGTIKRVYYQNGKLKSEGVYLNDSIKNGWFKSYYEDGTIKSSATFLNGLQNGKTVFFYKRGKMEQEVFWKNGKSYGNANYYFQNGKLDTYSCYDLFGEIMYVMKWDSLGNKIKEEGLAISINRQINFPSDSVPLGKELTLNYTAAQPPNHTTFVKIKEINVKGEELSEQTYPIIENTVTYKKTFNHKGKYKIVAIGEVKDSNGNTITLDTVETEITVL